MDTSKWPKCPKCGLPNIPERQICKRCRANMHQEPIPVPPKAYTEATGTLYIAVSTHSLLFLCPYYMEYSGPGITIRTAWANVDSIRADGAEEYIWLNAPAAITLFRSADPKMNTWMEHTVPLGCFGYPANQNLVADLRRFAPQLWKLKR